jgi:hypothetical protein
MLMVNRRENPLCRKRATRCAPGQGTRTLSVRRLIELAVWLDRFAHSADAQQADDLKRTDLSLGKASFNVSMRPHAETLRRLAFKIELDDDDGLPDHPSVVARLNREDMRRLVLNDATVRVLDVDFTTRQKAGVRMHAEIGADDVFHVFRPSESRWIDHPLDARVARASNIEAHVTEVAVRGASHGREQRIRCGSCGPFAARTLAARRFDGGSAGG